jgi:hypothetical protein
MAHTFDIRFARTAGFAALLEAPTNSFRWKGSGRLSIDAHGISIAVRRGLLALFPRTRRVAAADLKGVLREGHALRVEFSDGLERMVVPFWVRDPRTAEEIVRLLPTTRTVELDHEAAGVGNARFRPDWRVLMIVIVLVSSAITSFWSIWRHDALVQSTPVTVAQPSSALTDEAPTRANINAPAGVTQDRARVDPIERPRDSTPVPYPYPNGSPRVKFRAQDEGYPAGSSVAAVSATAEPMALAAEIPTRGNYVAGARVTDGVVPIEPGMALYETARRKLDRFELDIASLAGDRGSYEAWWEVTVRISQDPEFDHPDLRALRDAELAVSRAWRSYLYARDAQLDSTGFEREFAQRITERLPLYVR